MCELTKETYFKREDRYLVFKNSDIEKHFFNGEKKRLYDLANLINGGRINSQKKPLKCLVVEKDWPEYEPVFKMIEARVNGTKTEEQKRTQNLEACLERAINGLEWYKDAHPDSWSEADEENLQAFRNAIDETEKTTTR